MTRKPVQPPDATPSADEEDDDSPSPKKERVLHTRVPAVLEQELKRFARNLRVPVSNVVRAILEDALQVADRASGQVEERLKDVVRAVSSERETIREKLRELDPTDDVLGYQPMVVARESSCTRCHTPLRRGESAWLGITTEPGKKIMVCGSCVPSGGDDAEAGNEESTKE